MDSYFDTDKEEDKCRRLHEVFIHFDGSSPEKQQEALSILRKFPELASQEIFSDPYAFRIPPLTKYLLQCKNPALSPDELQEIYEMYPKALQDYQKVLHHACDNGCASLDTIKFIVEKVPEAVTLHDPHMLYAINRVLLVVEEGVDESTDPRVDFLVQKMIQSDLREFVVHHAYQFNMNYVRGISRLLPSLEQLDLNKIILRDAKEIQPFEFLLDYASPHAPALKVHWTLNFRESPIPELLPMMQSKLRNQDCLSLSIEFCLQL